MSSETPHLPTGWTRLRELSAHEWGVYLVIGLCVLGLLATYAGLVTLGLGTLRDLPPTLKSFSRCQFRPDLTFISPPVIIWHDSATGR